MWLKPFLFSILLLLLLLSVFFLILPVWLVFCYVFLSHAQFSDSFWAILLSNLFLTSSIVFGYIIFFSVKFYFSLPEVNSLEFYRRTKFVEVLDIIIEELTHSVYLKSWPKVFVLEDEKKLIYSYGTAKEEVIVFSSAVLMDLIEKIKEDAEKSLMATQSLLAHEISHLKNYDYIVPEFFKLGIRLINALESAYFNLLLWIKKIFYKAPLPLKEILFGPLFEAFFEIFTFIFGVWSKMFSALFRFLRRTLAQDFEHIADQNAVKAVGINSFFRQFEVFGHYSSLYSLHATLPQTRKNAVEHLLESEKKLSFEEKNVQIVLICILTSLLVLIFLCLLSVFLFNTLEIGLLFKDLFFNIKAMFAKLGFVKTFLIDLKRMIF